MTDFEDRARCYKTGVHLGDTVEDLGQLLEDLTEDTLFGPGIVEAEKRAVSPGFDHLTGLIQEKVGQIDTYLMRSGECGLSLRLTDISWNSVKQALKEGNSTRAWDDFEEFNRHLAKME